jgi:hypothetical protein
MESLKNQRDVQQNYPSGVFSLLEPEYSAYVLSTLVESPPNHNGTVDRLQQRSGVPSPQLEDYLRLLEEVDVVELDNTGENATYIIQDSTVLSLLVEMNTLLNEKFSQSMEE